MVQRIRNLALFFFNDTATTEIYTHSLHDALPIYIVDRRPSGPAIRAFEERARDRGSLQRMHQRKITDRSEEHTSELQSHLNLVCRLLLEKNKKSRYTYSTNNAYKTLTVNQSNLPH